MQQEKFIMFQNRLSKVFHHLRKQARRLGVSCYRIYDHDLPEFPFLIEKYEEKLYVAEYKRRHGLSDSEYELWLSDSLKVMEQVIGTDRADIFLKLRRRKSGRKGQYKKLTTDKHEFIIHENGLKFLINLTDYVDTGLYLDHRLTREKVREEAISKKVLNLFSYTGSFSVYAAAGGAEEIVSVDLSNTYLKWAERNFQLNGFPDSTKYKFVRADVMQYLRNISKEYFDLVILDPPTFSNSQRMEGFLDVQRDHPQLINDCLKSMKNGAVLYFSTNFQKFVFDSEKIKAASIKDITKQTTPFDFDGRRVRKCYRIIKNNVGD